ncbi:hypothetical protein KW803_02740 [Candidatus Saccharibacteria bacterium]|nr:hypothetical protein [Candidatus Saccharibacteria bacterium]
MKNLPALAVQKTTSLIDRVNDRVTSYRLVLYFLIALVLWAMIGSFFDYVPYSWNEILVSAAWLLGVCWLSNKLISKFMDIPANKESDLITALILTLILTPPKDRADFAVLAAAGVAAMASKYIITYHKSHIFNPAAVGAFISGEVFNTYASWWVGTKFLTPLVVVGGVLIMRKMKRFTMVSVFIATYLLYLIYTISSGNLTHLLWLELVSTQVLFFGYIMLTEPLTSPTNRSRYIPYAILVGFLYTAHRLKLSPEEALLIGNAFTFIFARNRRWQLKYIRRIKEAEGIYSYLFQMPKGFKFQAGQYMEWTIASNKTDSRGNRRYLTIASSPTEPGLMFTVKHPKPASSFKQRLDKLKTGDSILASQIAGSFNLPKDQSKKIALIAGGIGVTPFRSMAKYLTDSGQQRDVALLYSATSPYEISYRDVFNKAKPVGLTPSYISGERLDETKIKSLLPDYKDRRYYVSGPYSFVNALEVSLLKLGVSPAEIITDYFPGYGS